ncbi:ATP synthase delta chain, chloroplastic [Linum perenne]
METLPVPGSVSTFKLPSLHPPPRQIYTFKTPTTASLHHHQYHSFPHHHHHHNLSAKPNSQSAAATLSLPTTKSAPPNTHHRPESGYAAALMDIAQCRGALDVVQKDVRRLSRLLRNDPVRNFLGDPLTGSEEKGRLVKEVGKRGRIGELLMGLVRMLIVRNRVGLLGMVLMEFERICDEMGETQRVLVSTVKKMEKGEMLRIARTVHQLSGGKSVKLRNLISEDGAFL